MNALSEGHADPRIDYVISNDGSFEELKKKVKDLLIYINRKK
jgi:dephospho-CoA kinase